MIIIYNTAVGADRDIYAGLFEILVSGRRDFLYRGRLSSADTLGLTGDADGTAADTDLDKVSACLRQETETVPVNDVARAYLDSIAILLTDPADRSGLPFAVAFRRVNAEYIRARLDELGNSFLVISGIDTRADHITLMGIQQLILIGLMAVIVFPEYHILQTAFFIQKRQGIDLVVPDNIVAVMQAGIRGRCYQLVQGRHEIGDLQVQAHSGNPVVSGGDNTDQSAMGCTVICNRYG